MKGGGIAERVRHALVSINRRISPAKPILGVDFGSNSIKLAKVKKNGSSVLIELLHYRQIPVQNMPAEESQKQDQFTRELKTALLTLKLKNQFVATGVAGSSVIVREAKLPALPPQELARTLAFEAEPFIPYDIREVNLDYHILREITEEAQQKYEVILVAVKKDLLESRLGILTAAGLKPIVVDVNAFALVNLLEYVPKAKDETVVVANIGATVTNLAIVESGSPRVVRDVAVAGNAFTRALQSALSIDEATAEKLKRETGLILTEEKPKEGAAPGESQAVQVSNTLAGVASDLLTEIHRSTDFYLAHGQERTIHRIYLTGGGALLKNLAPFASNQLKLPTEILNPLQVLNASTAASAYRDTGPMLATACGLALRNWNDWAKQ